MSQPCTTSKCDRISRGLCDCCKQNLCLQHLSEHNASLVAQLNPLTDEINTLGERLKAFKIHEVVSDGRQKLEKWRRDCHEKIDLFFGEKCQELDRLVASKLDQQQKEIFRMQSKVAKLVREQEATRQDIDSLTETIQQLEKEMKQIEETNIRIATHSLVINDNLVLITETKEEELDLSKLSTVYRTLVSPPGSWTPSASNGQFLLIHQKPNLCLIDKELSIVKQVLWTHDSIMDMCWSSILDRFIVAERNNIFLVDEGTISIENVETTKKRSWLACTCSDASLFVSTNGCGSSVVELCLSPSVALVKEWKSPITCANDEYISGMDYKNKTCAIMIKNLTQKSIRMELRSCETWNRVWLFPLNITCDQNTLFHCGSLSCNEWLIADRETKRLLHIRKDGTLKSTVPYSDIPYSITMFGSDMLTILTNNGTNLHRI